MFVWKIVGRAIMVRDANCFHPFKDGVLSCIDCWWCQQSALSITTSSFFFFVAFLVVSFHHHSWTLLSDVVLWKKWPWRLLVILISWHYHLYHLGLGPLSSYVLSYFENWVEFETITTFPRFPATLGIVPLLAAISDWFSIVNLRLHLTIKPFQRTLMRSPKLPLESYMNWNYMQLKSEVLLACVVCCNCRCTACWWRTGEVFLFDMSCELWMQVLVIQTIWLLSLRFFI